MFSDFNKVFQSVIKRNTLLGKLMNSYDTRNYYPNGISKRKQVFTSSELIDIYIKGNQDIFAAMLESGFDDDLGFDLEERDWFKGLLDAKVGRNIYGEANRSVSKLVTYLDVPTPVFDVGYWAFDNNNVKDFKRLVSSFGKVSGISSFSLYYEFFRKIEWLRANRFDLLHVESKSPTAAEETAVILQRLEVSRREFEFAAKEINKIAENSESTIKGRNTSGEDQEYDAGTEENT